jgi:hypothetical protein
MTKALPSLQRCSIHGTCVHHFMQHRTLITGLCLSAAFLLTACSSDEGGSADGQTKAMPMVSPDKVEAPATTQSITVDPAAGGTGSPRLNPPHGEPGHVCEIPVGQPLDGSGGASESNSPVQSIQIDPNARGGTQTFSMPPSGGSPVQGGGSGRINPPHGEPGHVCEIPVGDPLP